MTYEQYCIFRDYKEFRDAKVAELAGIGRSTFSDWKSGRSEPKADKLEKIRKALDIPMTEFYSYENTQTILDVSNLVIEGAKKDLEHPRSDLAYMQGVADMEFIKKYNKLTSANKEVIKSTIAALLAAQDKPE